MTNTMRVRSKQKSAGDAAIDGLWAGVLSGLIMLLVLLAFALILGEAPLAVLRRFSPTGNPNPALGGLLHVAVSSLYGMFFGLLTSWTQARFPWIIPTWLLGLAYGMVLFLCAEWIVLPSSNSELAELPVWLFGLAHAIYGLVLGWLIGRNAG